METTKHYNRQEESGALTARDEKALQRFEEKKKCKQKLKQVDEHEKIIQELTEHVKRLEISIAEIRNTQGIIDKLEIS